MTSLIPNQENNVIEIPDLRVENLYLAVKQAVMDKGLGIPVASIIGCLELMKDEVKRIALEDV